MAVELMAVELMAVAEQLTGGVSGPTALMCVIYDELILTMLTIFISKNCW